MRRIERIARKRVVRSAGTKAKVALEAMSGMSPSQIANRFGVHPTRVASWKEQLTEDAETLFVGKRRKREGVVAPYLGTARQGLHRSPSSKTETTDLEFLVDVEQ
jgi:transposase